MQLLPGQWALTNRPGVRGAVLAALTRRFGAGYCQART